MFLTIVAGVVIAGMLISFLINIGPPSFLRVESVIVTDRPDLLDALEARLAPLAQVARSELEKFPESTAEIGRLGGQDVEFETLRTHVENGELQIAVRAAIILPSSGLTRPVLVAARGFRVSATGLREPLDARELKNLAFEADSSRFHGG